MVLDCRKSGLHSVPLYRTFFNDIYGTSPGTAIKGVINFANTGPFDI